MSPTCCCCCCCPLLPLPCCCLSLLFSVCSNPQPASACCGHLHHPCSDESHLGRITYSEWGWLVIWTEYGSPSEWAAGSAGRTACRRQAPPSAPSVRLPGVRQTCLEGTGGAYSLIEIDNEVRACTERAKPHQTACLVRCAGCLGGDGPEAARHPRQALQAPFRPARAQPRHQFALLPAATNTRTCIHSAFAARAGSGGEQRCSWLRLGAVCSEQARGKGTVKRKQGLSTHLLPPCLHHCLQGPTPTQPPTSPAPWPLVAPPLRCCACWWRQLR